jgi:hypothetical protein
MISTAAHTITNARAFYRDEEEGTLIDNATIVPDEQGRSMVDFMVSEARMDAAEERRG